MEKNQKKLYHLLKEYYQPKIFKLVDKQGVEKSHFQILEALLRLRQTCCDPRLLKLRERSIGISLPPDLIDAQSTKTQEAMNTVKELLLEGHNILLFSQFVQMLDILQSACRRNGFSTFYLSGSTKNRSEVVEQFQTAKKPSVFLISLKAGGTGLNLTAANYVIHFDPWWNPAVEVQATDRAHRIGQSKSVTVYKMIMKDTIEEKIQKLQERKKALLEDIITTSKSKRLTRQDLSFLFS